MGVFMWAVVQKCIAHQVFVPDEQPRALRAADCLASAERDQVVPHRGVVPKVRHRRSVRSRIDKGGHLIFPSQFRPLLHLDLSRGIREVRKMHHRRFFVDGLSQILAIHNFHQPDPSGAQLMIKRIAVRCLDDHFGLHPRQIGKLPDKLGIVLRQNSRQPREHRCRGSRSYQRGIIRWQLQHFPRSVFRLPTQVPECSRSAARPGPSPIPLPGASGIRPSMVMVP